MIDEIQKVPKLLDIVHHLIETKKLKFVLTGSSARKLKKHATNLLAGRAFYRNFFPLTHIELDDKFNLEFALNWGALPEVFHLKRSDRVEYLNSYSKSYLKEEILQEQLLRSGTSFRNFLEITAQENGKCINFSNIARDVGVDVKTIQNYFQILEDTLVGYLIPAFSHSSRKSVAKRPKFYIFDIGIKRSLEGTLGQVIRPGTSNYGYAFEHFIMLECIRLNSYALNPFKISHFQTNSGGEIDLILSNQQETIAVEIKSSHQIDMIRVKQLARVSQGISAKKIKLFYLSQCEISSVIDSVTCVHWKKFLTDIFGKLTQIS